MWNWWINNLQIWKGNFLLPHCIWVFPWNWCSHRNLKWHLSLTSSKTIWVDSCHADTKPKPNQFFLIRYAGWAELGRRGRHRPTHVFGNLYSKNFKILSIFSITKKFPFTVAYATHLKIVSAHPDVMNWKIPQKYMINSSFTP